MYSENHGACICAYMHAFACACVHACAPRSYVVRFVSGAGENDGMQQYSGLFVMWVLCAFISTLYTSYWDLFQDWGLMKRGLPASQRLLRADLVYSKKVSTVIASFLCQCMYERRCGGGGGGAWRRLCSSSIPSIWRAT